jgi:hypothetical protein
MLLQFLDRHSRPGDSLLVLLDPPSVAFANDAFLYHLLLPKLRPGTYHLELNPGSANRPGSRLAREIREGDWVVVNRHWSRVREPNEGWKPGDPAIDIAFRERFRMVYESPLYRVFLREDRTRELPGQVGGEG